MKIFEKQSNLIDYISKLKAEGKKIGFVPTMGALHQGHLSLIKQSNAFAENMVTVSSIFVNPTQFNDKKDFEKYPITLDADLEQLMHGNCAIVFLPTVEEIYPKGFENKENVDLGFIGNTLDAAHRPGHFEGVIQVVKILLDIVGPDFLFLGQKDFQQCMVIIKLVEHFNFSTEVIICPTKREESGLAMSSRNMRLTQNERAIAANLYKVMNAIKSDFSSLKPQEWKSKQLEKLQEIPEITTEYLEIVNGATLEPINDWHDAKSAVILIAAKIGQVRLIDNLIIY